MLPDADVLAFKFGVAYGHAFGHRGFTHSLLFAFALPTLLLAFYRFFNTSLTRIWLFLFVSLLSHSVLDSLTTGGKGVDGYGHGVASDSFYRGKSLKSRRFSSRNTQHLQDMR